MVTFNDLKFRPRKTELPGMQALIHFENGYGASVIRGWGSYGNDKGLYELAVIKGGPSDWDLCYDSGITEDVEGHLTPEAVTYYLQLIELLK